jgi:hypothetical protein
MRALRRYKRGRILQRRICRQNFAHNILQVEFSCRVASSGALLRQRRRRQQQYKAQLF